MSRATAFRHLTHNRRLAAVLTAGALSAFGDWLYLAALPMVVYQSTHDPVLLGIAAAGRLVPFFLLSVPAGWIADRYDRRRVVIAAETVRATLMVTMAATAVLGGSAILLIVVATLSAATGTIAMPAQSALVPELAAEDELPLANAASMTMDHAAGIAAPLAAGVLVAAAGLGPACAVNALTFVIVVIALVGIGPDEDRVESTRDDHPIVGAAGDRGTIRTHLRAALPILTLDAAISFAAGAISVLPVLVAVRSLGGGEELAGRINAAAAAGAMLGAVAAGYVAGRDERRWIALGTIAGVLGLAAIALPALAVVLLGSVVAVAALAMLDTVNITRLQTTLPGTSHGRAFGILHTSAAAWLMAGSSIPPVVAGALSVGAGVALTALIVATLGGCSVAIDRRRSADARRAADHDGIVPFTTGGLTEGAA